MSPSAMPERDPRGASTLGATPTGTDAPPGFSHARNWHRGVETEPGPLTHAPRDRHETRGAVVEMLGRGMHPADVAHALRITVNMVRELAVEAAQGKRP